MIAGPDPTLARTHLLRGPDAALTRPSIPYRSPEVGPTRPYTMVIPERSVYATQPGPLRSQIADLLHRAATPEINGEIVALIVPDTNLLSGGSIAAEVYQTVGDRPYDSVILIAPSHSGSFERLTICSVDAYRTPLGEVPINDQVRNELCDEDDDIFLDDRGHYHTAGIDVQLPFLQERLDGFDVVPIVMGGESPDLCKELGHAVGEVMYNRATLLVACANVLEATQEGLDRFTEYFEALDTSRLMALLNSEEVRMEGKGAVLTALIAAVHRRANRARVLHTSPPADDEPGFIGAVLWRE